MKNQRDNMKAICIDWEENCKIYKATLRTTPHLEMVSAVHDNMKAVAELIKTLQPDFIILRIFFLADLLPYIHQFNCHIIFTTVISNSMGEVIDHIQSDALHYQIHPLDRNILVKTVAQFRNQSEKTLTEAQELQPIVDFLQANYFKR